MECVLNGKKIKYEHNELWLERIYKHKTVWYKIKGSWRLAATGSKYKTTEIQTNKIRRTFLWHRIIYKLHNPEWDIMDVSDTNLIDHVNNDTTNNNIENLRVVNRSQNGLNRKKKSKHYTFHKNHKKYFVRITIDGKTINDKLFIKEEDAIKRVEELKKLYPELTY